MTTTQKAIDTSISATLAAHAEADAFEALARLSHYWRTRNDRAKAKACTVRAKLFSVNRLSTVDCRGDLSYN